MIETRTVLFQSLNQMFVCLIVHYIIANSSFPENSQHSNAQSAYQPQNIECPMFQIQIIDTYCISIFKIYFPSIKTTYHRFKTQVKIIKFCFMFRMFT